VQRDNVKEAKFITTLSSLWDGESPQKYTGKIIGQTKLKIFIPSVQKALNVYIR